MECVSLLGKCRACRIKTQKEFQHHIFTTENLQQIFHEATSLEIHENDGLPGILCDDCHSRLIDTFKFRQMCATSAVTFQQILAGEVDSDYEEKYKPPEDIPAEEDTFAEQYLNISEEKFNPLESLVETELVQDEESLIEPIIDEKCPLKEKKPLKKRKAVGDPLLQPKDDPDWSASKIPKPRKPRKSRKKIREEVVVKNEFGEIIPPVEYECKTCGKKYKNREGFKSHVRFSHPEERVKRVKGAKITDCHLCGKKYSNSSILARHIRHYHQCQNSAECDFCGKGFKSKDGLKGHMVRYHGASNMIRCSLCTKFFSTQEGFDRHMKEWHDPENPKEKPKNFMCDLCGKAFSSPAGLLKHTNSHAGIKPYQCTICPKAYQTTHRLKIHMMRHEGIKEHVCTVCGLRKTTSTELKVHMSLHNKDKVFPCTLCPKTFYAQGNYQLHMRTVHQGIKAFKCKYCEQSFARHGTLKHHVMTHTGEKPHACEECGKRFIQLTALNTHKRTHGAHGRSSKIE